MSQPFRLQSGGRLARDSVLRFTFDGRSFEGYSGDSAASALLANGVHLIGRSFKYHRPRGIVGAGHEEPNGLLTVDSGGGRNQPNIIATTLPLTDGLVLRSQHRWPSLRFDLGRVSDLLSPFLAAGFYYKTFLWPASAWHRFYEPAIRHAAGAGTAPTGGDPDQYVQRYAHCDILVVGGGPAGLAAALAASEHGAHVMLCDDQAELGGSLLSDPRHRIDGIPAWDWIAQALDELRHRDCVRVLSSTTAFAYGVDNFVSLVERLPHDQLLRSVVRERLWFVRAREVILATGAFERPVVFSGNDRPGVMLGSAARTYVNRYAVQPGLRAVVVASHDSGYEDAFELQKSGVAISAVVDVRTRVPADVRQRAAAAGIEILENHVPNGTRGTLRVRQLFALPRGAAGSAASRRTLNCDLVLMSGGWTPTVHLYSQARGTLRWDDKAQAFLPDACRQAVRCVGAVAGRTGLDGCLAHGTLAGHDAAVRLGKHGPRRMAPRASGSTAPQGGLLLDNVAAALSADRAFVDLQGDVTSRDIELAVREGLTSVEHVKRYTTLGMATDQGRTSNLHGLAIIARALGRSVQQLGLTSFRPPFTPVTFGSLAGVHRGDLFDPIRTTPIHEWAVSHGAVFEDVGLWKRARYFPRDSEDMNAAVIRECKTTRAHVGIFDASTLGKIEVVGPDAAEFMNRMYTNAWTKLEVGRCRYGLLLREDGFVFDDGVVARLARDRFHVTTTTGGAPRVLHHMEDYLQTEFSELEVWLSSTTDHWAVIAVSGPAARSVLEPLVENVDLAAGAFPHMAIREGHICGVPMRLFRVSFSGELGFEVNVPANEALSVWESIYAAGATHGIAPYGTETMHVLRAEKGYIIVGQETDGTVMPDDVGLGWAVGKSKRDFVGKRSLRLPAAVAEDRLQLVGLVSIDRRTVLPEGAQLLLDSDRTPACSQGHVTSAYFSAALDQPIALALLKRGRSRLGERMRIPLSTGPVEVEVVASVFIDPDGKRLNG